MNYRGYTIEIKAMSYGRGEECYYAHIKELGIDGEMCDTKRQAEARGKVAVNRASNNFQFMHKEPNHPFEFKVIIPAWWTDNGEYIEGLTDKIIDHPFFFPKQKTLERMRPDCVSVYIPDYDYAGSFPVETLIFIAN